MKRKTGRAISASLIALTLVTAMIFSFTMAEDNASLVANTVVNTQTDASLIQSPFAATIANVQMSVVGVNNYQNYTYSTNRRNSFGTPNRVEQLAATGSGVTIYEGYVLTNAHVVEGASRLTVSVLGSDEELEARLMSSDASLDIAILKVENLNLPAVPLGDSDQLQVGEWAICIGNPLSEELRGTVTTGIISALDRQIKSTTTTDRYGLKTTVTNTMIQTDAAINNGNSGGGLFNTLGQLMGIPSMKISASSVEGIGLAIPINSAKPLILEVLTNSLSGADTTAAKTEEASEKPRIGVSVSAINRNNNTAVNAGALPTGLMVASVEAGSPAERAGIQALDVIVEAEGAITTETSILTGIISAHSAGDTLHIKVYRAENLANAQTVSEIGSGKYIDFEIILTDFH